MDNLSKEDLERIVKCVVAFNGKDAKPVEFDKNFLKLYDYLELLAEDEGDIISLKVRMKK